MAMSAVTVMLVYWSEYINDWGSRNYRCSRTSVVQVI